MKIVSSEEKGVAEIDFSLVKKEYAHKWVALSPNHKKLLAVGDSLSDVLKQTGKEEVAVMQVLPDTGYAPASL